MKLILFYAHSFSYKTASKSLDSVPDVNKEGGLDNAVVVFFHVEEKDEEEMSGVIQKFVKNTKWLCGKFKTKNVVLHSFNHLSSSKSSPETAQQVLHEVIERLERTDHTVIHTPFGYFNEFTINVAGDSLAKVYKEF
ncbi:MAG: threonyl-tRNA synthetase editing domain-containing protein [Nitrospirota bacterium]|nr:MAG: threonyl-tRNA synthetase editing domain-containing protein [Nitrospirota bacterium]